MPDSQLITFDSLSEQSSYIKVIGVGGGGNNAVNHMFRKGISGVDFIVCNTDMKALKGSPVPDKLVLGHEGLGVGGRPAKARKAAEEKESEIKALFEKDTKMVFITAGMGGGTGTGAAPVIARMAKEIKLEAEDSDDPTQILVVAVVTTPFLFEGFRRLQQAQEGVEELRKYVDSILVINNEKLRAYGDLVMTDAFAMANDVLLTAVKGIAEIITLNAYVNIDFRDVYTVMENSGTALMGIGEGEGEKRAKQAVEEATTSVLLNDNDIKGAKNVLLHFSFGPEHEITMDEMGEVTDYITQKTGSRETNAAHRGRAIPDGDLAASEIGARQLQDGQRLGLRGILREREAPLGDGRPPSVGGFQRRDARRQKALPGGAQFKRHAPARRRRPFADGDRRHAVHHQARRDGAFHPRKPDRAVALERQGLGPRRRRHGGREKRRNRRELHRSRSSPVTIARR